MVRAMVRSCPDGLRHPLGTLDACSPGAGRPAAALRVMTTPSEYFKDYLREELDRIGLKAVIRIIASIYRDKATELSLKADILEFEQAEIRNAPDGKDSAKYCEI